MSVHPQAIIEDGAVIADTATIGPFCCVGANCKINDHVILESHVVVEGRTTIGEGTRISPFAVLGGAPQHLGYKGEDTKLTIGQKNIIREHVTMNIGTAAGGGETKIGNNGLFMTGAHVAHDCSVGNNTIFANNATLGGHAVVGDHVFMGGLSAVHQFCQVGPHAFIGGCAAVIHDLIPFGSANGNYADLVGLNIIGLKRRGFTRSAIQELRLAYKLLFSKDEAFKDRLATVTERFAHCVEVMQVIDFIKGDRKRPIMMPGK